METEKDEYNDNQCIKFDVQSVKPLHTHTEIMSIKNAKELV